MQTIVKKADVIAVASAELFILLHLVMMVAQLG